ncbi:AAA family ATPase [Patescibacteria group bacterium]
MLIFNFLSWHYFNKNKFIFKVIFNFVTFSCHLFSVKFLLKTLFSPWHRIEIGKQEPGFSLQKLFHKLSFNLISRSIGFIARSFFISLGLLLSLIFIILGTVVLVLWQFLSPVSWLFYFLNLAKIKSEPLLKSDAKDFVYQRLGVKTDEEYNKIPLEDRQAVEKWQQAQKLKQKKASRFWEKENLLKVRSFGTDLAFGFTLGLDKYCTDLSFPPAFSHHLVGRKHEIRQIETVLLRNSQNNIILTGEAGTGKQTIVLGLAKAIKEKRVNPGLFYKRVLELNMTSILGQSIALPEAKARFENLLKEAQAAGNIILVINQLEKFASSAEGIDLTSVLAPILQKSKIQIIGITTPVLWERYIFPNQQIIKYFEKVEVVAPTAKQALDILQSILPDFEKGKKARVTYQALKEIIQLSESLITNIPFPEKAIDLLDQVLVQAEAQGKRLVLKEDVDKLVSVKTKVPVGTISQDEEAKLKNLSQLIHKQIINQKEAVEAIVTAMQRARLGISEAEKPIGSFLFLGPTGVGKTETAKALARAYFGSEKLMVRFDMSQYQDTSAVKNLIGSVETEKPGILVKQVRENPYGVLLLDEFEKANPEILNLFLTVFDEGYLKDIRGKNVSFKNLIIICTSNAAAEFIREKIGSKRKIEFSKFCSQVIEYTLQKNIFSPELVNRFDGTIVFKPLEPEHIKAIAKKLVAKLIKRLLKKQIHLEADDQVYTLLAELGYSTTFGARPMKRLIADKIETLIAKSVLGGEIKKGEKIKLLVDQNSKAFKIVQYS